MPQTTDQSTGPRPVGRVRWLPEPAKHLFKARFFQAIADVAGRGAAAPATAVSLQSWPQTDTQARVCLARAKRQPNGPLSRALKLAFLRGRYNWARRYFDANPNDIALCWQGLTGTRRAFMLGAQDAGARTFFAELSPLPGMLTLDPRGVNAEASVPQDPAFYDAVDPDPALLADLKARFQARRSTRSDVGQGQSEPPDAPYLFVPLQVPDDSQMILFAGWVGTVPGFIAALADASGALPEGWHLRIKEHPSAKTSYADQIAAAGGRLVLDNATDSFAQIAGSRGVVTVNSSMGLQAMFWDKPVVVTGESFYALPGVAHHAGNAQALERALADLPKVDQGLRARFLTWLATRYYIAETGDGFDAAAIAARLTGDL